MCVCAVRVFLSKKLVDSEARPTIDQYVEGLPNNNPFDHRHHRCSIPMAVQQEKVKLNELGQVYTSTQCEEKMHYFHTHADASRSIENGCVIFEHFEEGNIMRSHLYRNFKRRGKNIPKKIEIQTWRTKQNLVKFKQFFQHPKKLRMKSVRQKKKTECMTYPVIWLTALLLFFFFIEKKKSLLFFCFAPSLIDQG